MRSADKFEIFDVFVLLKNILAMRTPSVDTFARTKFEVKRFAVSTLKFKTPRFEMFAVSVLDVKAFRV